MNFTPRPVEQVDKVSTESFWRDIYPENRPALLKGQVQDWPAVTAGRSSSGDTVRYIRSFDRGLPVDTNFGQNDIKGKFFYNERLDGLNFTRKSRSISGSMERILNMSGREDPQAIYIQSVPVPDHLPGFGDENRLDIAHPSAGARIWIGNRAIVQAHFDLKENLES